MIFLERGTTQSRKYEEYAYVLDFTTRGRSKTVRGREGVIVTALGEERLTLLEVLGSDESEFEIGEKIRFLIEYEVFEEVKNLRIQVELLLDVGVSGLYRLLDKLERLKRAKVLIACAGMEGALPTVLAGLLSQPVIGVPVSVGYGVSAKGKTALEGMLASCAPGLVVVNIDNGYGAAMAALRILRA